MEKLSVIEYRKELTVCLGEGSANMNTQEEKIEEFFRISEAVSQYKIPTKKKPK